MKRQLKEKTAELEVIQGTTVEQMWDTDLISLRQNIVTEWEKADKDELAARQVKAERKAKDDGKKKGKGKGAKKNANFSETDDDDYNSDASMAIVKPSAPPPMQKKISCTTVSESVSITTIDLNAKREYVAGRVTADRRDKAAAVAQTKARAAFNRKKAGTEVCTDGEEDVLMTDAENPFAIGGGDDAVAKKKRGSPTTKDDGTQGLTKFPVGQKPAPMKRGPKGSPNGAKEEKGGASSSSSAQQPSPPPIAVKQPEPANMSLLERLRLRSTQGGSTLGGGSALGASSSSSIGGLGLSSIGGPRSDPFADAFGSSSSSLLGGSDPFARPSVFGASSILSSSSLGGGGASSLLGGGGSSLLGATSPPGKAGGADTVAKGRTSVTSKASAATGKKRGRPSAVQRKASTLDADDEDEDHAPAMKKPRGMKKEATILIIDDDDDDDE